MLKEYGQMNRMINYYFIAIDANEIGKRIEKYILNEQHEELAKFSTDMSKSVNEIQDFISCYKGKTIMAGGDNILAQIVADDVDIIVGFVRKINVSHDYKFALGLGVSSSGAYLALKYAKVTSLFAIKYEDDKFIRID